MSNDLACVPHISSRIELIQKWLPFYFYLLIRIHTSHVLKKRKRIFYLERDNKGKNVPSVASTGCFYHFQLCTMNRVEHGKEH